MHVTPGGVATEEDVRAPRRPHDWSSELLGPIGKLLKSDQLHLTPLNHHFTPLHLADIPPLSPEVKEKMSTDAVLLHDLSQYVNTGIPGSDNIAQRKIGPLNHSRWLTHATRIERLLLSTNPDEPFYSNLVLYN